MLRRFWGINSTYAFKKMLCFRCGSPIEDDAGQCTNCGQELSDAPAENAENFADIKRRLRESSPNLGHDATFRVGEVVAGRYEITDVLGSGALGVVYKAKDSEKGIEVAVKVVASDFLSDGRARERFVSVIARAKEIVRSNAVQVFDVGVDGDRVYVVSQFLEGLSLRKIIELRRRKGQRFSKEEVAPIYSQLCAAVGGGQSAVVHGGLKPANVIISRDVLVVTDFFLLEAVSAGPFMAAQRGMGVDAVRFAATEIQNREPFDRRADVFAIAGIVVELLSGEPWDGGEVELSEIDDDIEPEVDDVLNRALDAEAQERQRDAAELAEALDLAFAGLPAEPVAGAAEAREVSGVYVESEADDSDNSEPSLEASSDRLTESSPDWLPDPLVGPTSEAEDLPTKPFGGAVEKTGAEPDAAASDLQAQDAATGRDPDQRGSAAGVLPEAKPRSDSQITQQLDLDDLEFQAEEQAWFEGDPILDQDDDHLNALVASAASGNEGEPAGADTVEKTRRYAPAELEQVLDDNEDDAPILGNRDHSVSGELRHMLARGELATPGLSSPEGAGSKGQQEHQPETQKRERHARKALVAFDSELPAAPEASENTQRVGPLDELGSSTANVAPEVPHQDAVPPPMDATIVASPAMGQPEGQASFLRFLVAMAFLGVVLGFGFWFFWGQEKLAGRVDGAQQDPAAERLVERAVAQSKAVALASSETPPPDASANSNAPTTTRLVDVDARIVAELAVPNAAPLRKLKPVAAKAATAPKTSPATPKKSPATPKKTSAPVTIVAATKATKECYAGMAFVKASTGDGYCIDRFESPGRGKKPSQVSLAGAKTGCMARGLRLCSAKEWTRACGGRFPYGRDYDSDRCNTESGAASPAGSRKGCRSRWGVYDMSGNVAEWVAGGAAMGGHASSDAGHASCLSRSGSSKMTGFRCCSEPRWD